MFRAFFPLIGSTLLLTACHLPLDCMREETRPASVFAIEAPASAVASQPVPIKAWVALSTAGIHEAVQPDSFVAKVQSNRIAIAGKVTAHIETHALWCMYPAMPPTPTAKPVEISVALAPGTYYLLAENFPWSLPTMLVASPTFPRPTQTVTITVQ